MTASAPSPKSDRNETDAVRPDTRLRAATPLHVTYTNYRGETSVRRIVPLGAPVWESSDWHPEPQWLLRAFDVDKNETRSFALKDFGDAQARVTALEAENAELRAEVERGKALVDRLILEAQIWKGEARCQTSIVYEAYRAVTEGKGEPGNWNGARPIVDALHGLRAEVERLTGINEGLVRDFNSRLVRDAEMEDRANAAEAKLARLERPVVGQRVSDEELEILCGYTMHKVSNDLIARDRLALDLRDCRAALQPPPAAEGRNKPYKSDEEEKCEYAAQVLKLAKPTPAKGEGWEVTEEMIFEWRKESGRWQLEIDMHRCRVKKLPKDMVYGETDWVALPNKLDEARTIFADMRDKAALEAALALLPSPASIRAEERESARLAYAELEHDSHRDYQKLEAELGEALEARDLASSRAIENAAQIADAYAGNAAPQGEFEVPSKAYSAFLDLAKAIRALASEPRA